MGGENRHTVGAVLFLILMAGLVSFVGYRVTRQILLPVLRAAMQKRLYAQAMTLTKQEDWPQAARLWRRYFRWGGEDDNAYYCMAMVERELSDTTDNPDEKRFWLDDALIRLATLIRRNENDALLLRKMGDILLERSHYAADAERDEYWHQAEDSYRKAITVDPAMAQAWGNWGTLLLTWGRYAPGVERNDLWQRAEDCYLQATTLDENAAVIWAHLGRLAWMRADFTVGESRYKLWSQAEKYYDRAIRLDPDLSMAQEDRTNLLIERASHTAVPMVDRDAGDHRTGSPSFLWH